MAEVYATNDIHTDEVWSSNHLGRELHPKKHKQLFYISHMTLLPHLTMFIGNTYMYIYAKHICIHVHACMYVIQNKYLMLLWDGSKSRSIDCAYIYRRKVCGWKQYIFFKYRKPVTVYQAENGVGI